MPITLSILDETTAGARRDAGSFVCDAGMTTLRELLRLRVKQEVERFNNSDCKAFQGLVQPEENERLLNGERQSQRFLNWEKQYASAITAFQANGFLVFVDNRQVNELDEAIQLQPQTKVTFLKLVPLIGG